MDIGDDDDGSFYGEYDMEISGELAGNRGGYEQRHLDLAAGGRQGSRHRPNQLIIDGLNPEAHMAQAFGLVHPFLKNKSCTNSVRLALELRTLDSTQLVEWRGRVVKALEVLADATAAEDQRFLEGVPDLVSRVLAAYSKKKIAFMRELWYVTRPEDYAAVSSLCTGLPMIGWTPPAFGLLPRVRAPSDT